MARRPATNRRWCCGDKSRTRDSCRISSLRTSPALFQSKMSAAMPKLGTNRQSGGRRGAGLEGCAPRRNGKRGDIIVVIDDVRNGRQRQLRQRGDERVAQQRNGGADRAVVVGVLGRRIGWRRRRSIDRRERSRNRRRTGRRVAVYVLAMDMTERQNELQGQRQQRQPAACLPVRSKPAHVAVRTVPANLQLRLQR
jgi:hypothetical protein